MKKFSLGDRMKEFYEKPQQTRLQRRTYTIIRIDGKAFHTYTRGLKKPFDEDFVHHMNETAVFLCKNIQGAKVAYVQSDEISIVLTDFDKISTSAWFGGNVQKIVSISSSLATARFNQLRPGKLAMFDSRVFTMSTLNEVANYLIWRQQDAVRNSIQSLAQSMFSHKELENKNCNKLQDMCFNSGINWNDIDPSLKRGRVAINTDDGWVAGEAPNFSFEIVNQIIPNISEV